MTERPRAALWLALTVFNYLILNFTLRLRRFAPAATEVTPLCLQVLALVLNLRQWRIQTGINRDIMCTTKSHKLKRDSRFIKCQSWQTFFYITDRKIITWKFSSNGSIRLTIKLATNAMRTRIAARMAELYARAAWVLRSVLFAQVNTHMQAHHATHNSISTRR